MSSTRTMFLFRETPRLQHPIFSHVRAPDHTAQIQIFLGFHGENSPRRALSHLSSFKERIIAERVTRGST